MSDAAPGGKSLNDVIEIQLGRITALLTMIEAHLHRMADVIAPAEDSEAPGGYRS